MDWVRAWVELLVVLGFMVVLDFVVVLDFLVVLGVLDSLEQLEPLAFGGHFPRVSQHNSKPCER